MSTTTWMLFSALSLTTLATTSSSPSVTHINNEDLEIFPVNLQHRVCKQPLGMESGNITDDQISVSSSLPGISHGKEYARLNGNSAWVTNAAIPERWIQINFVGQRMVNGISTQGTVRSYPRKQWVSAYQVQYKVNADDLNWKTIKDPANNLPRRFQGNADGWNVVTNFFIKPVQAEVVRIIPIMWPYESATFAMRLELLGCQIEQSGCDSARLMTRPSGYISSMNHPGKYSNNANCLWEITAPEDQTIVLEFQRFALEGLSKNCPLEFVEIYDVVGDSETSLGKFCGKTTPPKFVSTANILKVQFMSDHYESDVGFKAHYQFYNGSGCGGPQTLNDQQGSFHSTNYPRYYDSNSRCKWDITVEEGKLIEVTFVDLHIIEGLLVGNKQGRPRCGRDSLQINNVGTGSRDGVAIAEQQYCGHKIPPNFVSTSNRLHVTFQSDRRISDRGFNATYKAVAPSGCGGKRDRTATTGVIQSKNYPHFYDEGLECEWNIIAQGTAHIQLTFHDFELEEDKDCRYDHVSIYDGLSDRYLLGKYCNHATIQPLVAHSGSMKIVFVSDHYNHHRGFNATYVIKPFTTTTQISTTSPSTVQDQTIRTTSTTTTSHVRTTTSTPTTSTTTLKTAKSPKTQRPIYTVKPVKLPDSSDGPDGKGITQEMAKWLIVGLAIVSGFMLILVVFVVILCCRQHISGSSVILQGSLKEANNSSVMQNHAYDFDFPSTNHSIRSRQVERPETPQVSETLSQQGTLRRAPSRESHIYFSIEEYNTTHGQKDVQVSNRNLETPSVKVHYKKHASEPKLMSVGSDESPIIQSEEEIDGEVYTDDGEDCNTFIEDSAQETDEPGRSSRSNTIERKHVPFKNFEKTKSQADGSKMMVDNILYESADSIDQDG